MRIELDGKQMAVMPITIDGERGPGWAMLKAINIASKIDGSPLMVLSSDQVPVGHVGVFPPQKADVPGQGHTKVYPVGCNPAEEGMMASLIVETGKSKISDNVIKYLESLGVDPSVFEDTNLAFIHPHDDKRDFTTPSEN